MGERVNHFYFSLNEEQNVVVAEHEPLVMKEGDIKKTRVSLFSYTDG